MNIAVIYAGGMGSRLHNYSRPKQFIEFRSKPIVIYTIEIFQRISAVDGIVVACLEDWIPYLRHEVEKYNLDKVLHIVPGGRKGQDSIYNGLVCVKERYPDDTMVLIHDGVRPLAMDKTILECIEVANEKGNCVVVVPAMETIVVEGENGDWSVPNRSNCYVARAPQCFRLGDVMDAHRKALKEEKHDFIDTCTMMKYYGYKFNTILGTVENIKITTPADCFMFRAILEAREEGVVFGL
jgi:2-C-methyl-D-erythritol 4-phosphate cytidylyltransferase